MNEYEESVDKQKEEMGEHHIERMNKGECTPEVGAIYLSLSSNAERVADQHRVRGEKLRQKEKEGLNEK